MSGRRLEKNIELDADAEQVWEAIATEPGIATWFVPHRVEPREGGTVGQDYGSGFETTGRITACGSRSPATDRAGSPTAPWSSPPTGVPTTPTSSS
jgi:hypothetical protein